MCRAPSSNKMFSLRRGVHFCTENVSSDPLYSNLSTSDYITSVWYTNIEIQNFKNDAKMCSRAIRQQNSRRKRKFGTPLEIFPSKILCTRGLEATIDLDRIRQRRSHVQKVINAQRKYQYLSPTERENYLAIISFKESFPAKCKALAEGSLDAKILEVDRNHMIGHN